MIGLFWAKYARRIFAIVSCQPTSGTGPFAPGESPDETAQLLDDLLMALLDLPSDGWIDLVEALPDELFDRIDRYLESSPVVERPSA